MYTFSRCEEISCISCACCSIGTINRTTLASVGLSAAPFVVLRVTLILSFFLQDTFLPELMTPSVCFSRFFSLVVSAEHQPMVSNTALVKKILFFSRVNLQENPQPDASLTHPASKTTWQKGMSMYRLLRLSITSSL